MSRRKYTIDFVIMIEPGDLEWQGIVLISSILAFVRDNYTIYVYCRKNKIDSLSDKTTSFLKKNGVQVFPIINDYHDGYPNGNKVIACAQKRNGDFSIFLDSDTAFIQPISFTDVLYEDSVTCVAAGGNTWTGLNGNWEYVYQSLGIPIPNERVVLESGHFSYPYYNAGFVAFFNGTAFSDKWLEITRKIDIDNNITNKRPWLDQIALPAAIKASELLFHELGFEYNRGENNSNPLNKNSYLVHYHHSMFVYRKGLNKLFSDLVSQYSGFENFYNLYNFYKVNK